jgi:hypothetical protein
VKDSPLNIAKHPIKSQLATLKTLFKNFLMEFPNNFRIKEKEGFFIPQEKFLFFWNNIFVDKFTSRIEATKKLNHYIDLVSLRNHE